MTNSNTTESSKGIDAQISEITYALLNDDNFGYHKANQAIKALLTAQLDGLLAELPEKETMRADIKSGSVAGWGITTGRNEVIDEVTEVIKKRRNEL